MLGMSLLECEKEISEKLDGKKIHITSVAGKDVTNVPRSQPLRIHYQGNGYQCEVVFSFARVFRDIVLAFASNGAMPASFLSMCDVDSIQALRDKQSAASLLR